MSVDAPFMRRALELATAGWGQVSPNPLVGAVVERQGVIVGEGAHRRFGEAHAELGALAAAGAKARGAALHVTLEPCDHEGKTPPCTRAIIAAGIAHVVIAVRDPNPEASGGLERLRAAGIEVTVGVEEQAARELNAPFFHRFGSRRARPWVTLKLAMSLDGAIADHRRSPGMFSGAGALREVHRLRAGHDAIGVGMGTVLADDPMLTVRDVAAPRRPPLRVVFSRMGRLPLTARLAQSVHESPVLVFAHSPDPAYEHLLQGQRVEVASAASLAEALRQLAERDVRSLLVEGGAQLTGALLAEDLVDRLVLVQSPYLLGRGALPAFGEAPSVALPDARRLRIVRRQAFDDDLLTVYALGEA